LTIGPLGVLTLTLAALSPAGSPAQAVRPERPKEYDVTLSYDIKAPGLQHVYRFGEMLDALERAGFRPDPLDPDESAGLETGAVTRPLTGRLPSDGFDAALAAPHVRTLLLLPRGFQPRGEDRVVVQLLLAPVGGPRLERLLADQTRERLSVVPSWREKVGYDHQQYRRLLGTVRADDLRTFLEDLRVAAAGQGGRDAFAPLPSPIRYVAPIRAVEVYDVPEGVPESADVPPPPPEKGEPWLQKVAPELRGEGKPAENGPDRLRLEVVFTDWENEEWRRELNDVPEAALEGHLGSVVTVAAPRSAIPRLAQLPTVAGVRSPRRTEATIAYAQAPRPMDIFRATGLDRLHALGYRGAGVTVAVIDSSFAGWQSQLGKGLPRSTTLLDFTAARNSSVGPDPDPAPNEAAPGRGTALALAAARAAPEAQFTLVRLDPAAAYMLFDVARYVYGDTRWPDLLRGRLNELVEDGKALDVRRAEYTELRNRAMEAFAEDVEGIRLRKAEEEARTRLAADAKLLAERSDRLFRLEAALKSLARVRVVACALTWNEGYPVDASSALDLFVDGNRRCSRPPGCTDVAWFQAVGDTRGQVWGGPYRASDRGVLEFAPPDSPLPRGVWTSELNFLAWRPAGEEPVPDLPAGLTVRAVLQWAEARNPDFPVPLSSQAAPRILLLRQRDPTGRRLGTDDLNVVARAQRPAAVVTQTGRSVTFEQILEFPVDTPGRFALRVESPAGLAVRVPQEPALPALDRAWEWQLRLFVTSRGRAGGQVVLRDFAPDVGGPGMPADAVTLPTVGTAPAEGGPEPLSLRGSYPGMGLAPRPVLVAFNPGLLSAEAAYRGSDASAAFAAGTAAAMLSAGGPPFLQWARLPTRPGGLLAAPPAWLQGLRPARVPQEEGKTK
jgi:hypothetical protein